MKSSDTYKGSSSGYVYKTGFEDVTRAHLEKLIRAGC